MKVTQIDKTEENISRIILREPNKKVEYMFAECVDTISGIRALNTVNAIKCTVNEINKYMADKNIVLLRVDL